MFMHGSLSLTYEAARQSINTYKNRYQNVLARTYLDVQTDTVSATSVTHVSAPLSLYVRPVGIAFQLEGRR